MCSFKCLHHQPVFFLNAASFPKMASLLWYLTEDLNLLSLFNRNVGLTKKCAMVKVSENVKEDEPLPQALVDMTNTKNKTFVACITKNIWRLICLTNQLENFHRAVSKVFSGCLSSIPICLSDCFLWRLNFLHRKLLYNTKQFSCFKRALRLLPESFNLSAFDSTSAISPLKKKPWSWS